MTNSDEIVEAEFVRFIISGELDKIKEAFENFASHLISFIHKPIHWVEKHHCLVRLNAIFSVHTATTECRVTHAYLSLAISRGRHGHFAGFRSIIAQRFRSAAEKEPKSHGAAAL